ncbi:sulfite exporter TauE/SafE family protein [Roseococcus sp. SDR]|uniref:sulfite exporter TauE/SafE family protein n=1 Tax=Roseococcus sp. SDR TaxID=2835532 RepID=UPI001BD11093|nr:sulfite exporter TauE/SafE family protein [Roseococcus sp. SDR]MBS7792477.1 sulfite exporter TauE/SafE family protein [Roseococcus sp. SDR]MBV1847791.1 sulfite exporter TauE/SafE family protein [Roseococcus sp. SDR]
MDLSLWTLVALLLAGAGVGLAGGLLGIGGGVIAVPALLEILSHLPVEQRLPLAIGTAQAVILLSAVTAVRAHAAAGSVEPGLLRAWLPAMVLGAVLGLVLAPFAPAALSLIVFAVIAAALATTLVLELGAQAAGALPRAPWGWVPPGLIGLASAALGVGAGTLSGPVFGLFGVGLHRAVGAGAVFNLAIAAPATLVALAGGQVSLPGLILLAAPAMLVAPAAARLSRRLPQRALRWGFALCLYGIAARVAWRALGG